MAPVLVHRPRSFTMKHVGYGHRDRRRTTSDALPDLKDKRGPRRRIMVPRIAWIGMLYGDTSHSIIVRPLEHFRQPRDKKTVPGKRPRKGRALA